MLKKAVKQRQLVLSAQTLRTLTASELGQVNGGLQPAFVSGQSVGDNGDNVCGTRTNNDC